MGAIISFHQVNKSQALYEETRQALVETLTALEEELLEQTVRLAMLKAWKEWDDTQPPGSILDLSLDMLGECADPQVRALTELIVLLQRTVRRLGNPANDG